MNGIKVQAGWTRRDDHATCFEFIHLTFTITSDDTDEGSVKRKISITEESLCPVWAMIKNNVKLTTEFHIDQKVCKSVNV